MMIATFGAILVVLLGFAALAVDVANAYVVRGILQHAVDDAARTAQRWSAQVDDPGVDPGAVQAQAVAAASSTARRDIEAHGLAGVTVVETALVGSRLRIAARASVRTWFLRVLGIASWLPSASSDAALWAAVPPASSTAAPSVAVGTPAFPPVAGPLPSVTLPEGPAGGLNNGAQPRDTAAGPGPAGGSTSGDSSGPAGGGDIMEGP
ncbi:MAG TPA: pilus assembly protein TadG-related protein [bacterium]|nr:pilus assembly protein TadG-related protein [bacterium]